ncbi:MAG: hypothetical protein ACK5LO_10740 [Leucobacter sp.]
MERAARSRKDRQEPRISVDVIDDLLFTGAALASAVEHRRLPIDLHRVESNWIPYITAFDEAAGAVVVRAELSDHVPTVLKVRAIASIGAVPVVLADRPSPAHARRLIQAGAHGVLTREHSFDALLQALLDLARDSKSSPRTGALRPAGPSGFERLDGFDAGVSEVRLSDRELQVASLYVGRSAPSATVIAELLGVPFASVRTYLQRARAALRPLGPTSNRESLHRMLVSDGWVDAGDGQRD